jgi:hypothetical protein
LRVVVDNVTVYQPIMSRKFIAVAAWVALACIAYITLSPSGLRPRIADPNLERFGAYAVSGLLLGMAYPNRRALFAIIIVGAAVLLEVLQLLTADRDGEFLEMLIKAAGGLAGVIFAGLLSRVVRRKDDQSVKKPVPPVER